MSNLSQLLSRLYHKKMDMYGSLKQKVESQKERAKILINKFKINFMLLRIMQIEVKSNGGS
ncbi:hypothetical protein HMPREF1633_03810 [Tissierellia bacterium S5-A11]|nr:hypothetical protein HMPREF1633_03810 [Tissierellia bacterium S5-A11]